MLFGVAILFIASRLVRAQPAPFSFCYGNVAYCANNEVILQCTLSTNGSSFLQPGTCYDMLNNPLSGALCAQSGPSAGDAVCFVNGEPPIFPSPSGGTAYQAPTATIQTTISPPTETPADIPGPGDPCFGDVSFCLPPGEFNGTLSEILKCNGTNLVPHDCNDYLNYPPNGAVCIYDSFIDGKAVCHAIGQPTPALRSPSSGTLIIPTDGGSPQTPSPTPGSVPSGLSNSPSTGPAISTGPGSTAGVASPSATHASNAIKACVSQIWPVVIVLQTLVCLL